MTKKSRQKFKYENEKSFWDEIKKTFLNIFKEF